MIKKFKQNQFLFEELVKRDFKQKYKRTVLGMLWSVLSPLMNLLIMRIVFTQFFGRNIEHYTTYLFCGNLLFGFFKESTMGGMNSLMSNASIFSKVNIPKYMFLLSKNISSLVNFGLTICIFFVFVIFDGISINFNFISLIFPIICLIGFNIGVGLILSALFVFFRDIGYLYDIFTMLLMYMSAIFYAVDSYPDNIQRLFLCNPMYCYIKYFRCVILDGNLPSISFHLLCMGYAMICLLIGGYIYKRHNHRFLYYV